MQLPLPDAQNDPAADMATCRELLRNGSKTFFAASFLLPRQLRGPATALYAFCRLADDAVDCEMAIKSSVDRLRHRLHLAYGCRPWPHAADRAFSHTVTKYDIPRAIPEALLDGLAWDAEGRRYETIEALNDYAARVAGTVGAMMALLMGVRSPSLLARACDLGIAMQLTNIARDVGEDARAGRIYLPMSWLREAGIDPDEWLAAPRFTPELGTVIERLLQTADGLYVRADSGIAGLPARCRPGIRAARLLYAEIGHALRRNGLDSVARRTVVPSQRKLALLCKAVSAPNHGRFALDHPSLPETKFLVEATAGLEAAEVPLAWWDLYGQAVRLIEIMDRLERRERTVI
jgi:phytoene synthase